MRVWSEILRTPLGGEGRGGEHETHGQKAQDAIEDDGFLDHNERPAPHHCHPDQKERV